MLWLGKERAQIGGDIPGRILKPELLCHTTVSCHSVKWKYWFLQTFNFCLQPRRPIETSSPDLHYLRATATQHRTNKGVIIDNSGQAWSVDSPSDCADAASRGVDAAVPKSNQPRPTCKRNEFLHKPGLIQGKTMENALKGHEGSKWRLPYEHLPKGPHKYIIHVPGPATCANWLPLDWCLMISQNPLTGNLRLLQAGHSKTCRLINRHSDYLCLAGSCVLIKTNCQ